jgi:plastocyanin
MAGPRQGRSPIAAVAAAIGLALAMSTAACGGGALGLDHAPASLDPASPTLAAEGIAFDKAELRVGADRPITLVFENRESAPHNVSIYADGSHQQKLFQGVVVAGPATRWYPVPALAPGSYVFACDVHPAMTGRLVAS